MVCGEPFWLVGTGPLGVRVVGATGSPVSGSVLEGYTGMVITEPSSSTEVCTATLSPGDNGTATPGFVGDSPDERLVAMKAPLTRATTAAAEVAIMRR